MRRRRSVAIIACMLSAIVWQSACRSEKLSNTRPASNENATGSQLPAIKIRSTVFQDGELMPRPYTCDGPNVSPSLSWEDVPTGARTLALIADDPDAPGRTWVHWVLYNLPAETKGLVENVQKEKRLAGGAVQGINDFQKIGYDGPCPPSGTHRYYFKLYALDTELSLEPGATKEQLLEAMKGHLLAEGQLMAKYHR